MMMIVGCFGVEAVVGVGCRAGDERCGEAADWKCN